MGRMHKNRDQRRNDDLAKRRAEKQNRMRNPMGTSDYAKKVKYRDRPSKQPVGLNHDHENLTSVESFMPWSQQPQSTNEESPYRPRIARVVLPSGKPARIQMVGRDMVFL